MAAYTSIDSGDWDDGPTTWGTGAGAYPGSAAGDSFTVSAGDTVSWNLAALPGTLVGASTIAATGKVTVDANHNQIGELTGVWTVQGELEFNKTAGTWRLTFQGTEPLPCNVIIANGGELDMDATAADCYQYLDFNPQEDGVCQLICQAGSTARLEGRTRMHWTEQNGILTAGVSDHIKGDDMFEWEAGDVVLVLEDRTNYEEVTLVALDGNGWTFTAGTVANTYPDNCQLWNLGRSCNVRSVHATKDATVDFQAGMTALTCDWAGFDHWTRC